MNKELIELIADFMNEQWGHWMQYLYSKLEECYIKDDNEYVQVITPTDYFHWQKQMNTPYAELSEKEKDSDREWARKLLEVLTKYLEEKGLSL